MSIQQSLEAVVIEAGQAVVADMTNRFNTAMEQYGPITWNPQHPGHSELDTYETLADNFYETRERMTEWAAYVYQNPNVIAYIKLRELLKELYPESTV
jgi:hypothetical protein